MRSPFISKGFLTYSKERTLNTPLPGRELKEAGAVAVYLHAKVWAFQLLISRTGGKEAQLCLLQIGEKQRTGKNDQTPEYLPFNQTLFKKRKKGERKNNAIAKI